jgi:hypothetical protein
MKNAEKRHRYEGQRKAESLLRLIAAGFQPDCLQKKMP